MKINSIFIVVIIISLYSIFQQYWQKRDKILVHDAVFYYVYLPGILQYEDASFKFLDDADKNVSNNFLVKRHSDGIRAPKSTYGVALFELPFYTIAHQFAKFRNYKPNSFSAPYRLSILIACNFYLIIGLYYLRKLLLKYFSRFATELTIIIIVLGTNFFTYLTYVPGMGHGYTFFSASLFLYCIDKWQTEERAKYLYAACFFLGLIALIRPTNASFGIFLLLLHFESVNERLKFILKNLKFYIIGFLFMTLPLIPQFIYWKLNTGSWLFYSYGDETFFWNDPKIIEGLFSFRKGWLVYSPLMVLSLVGIFAKNEIIKKNRISIIFFLLINLYVTFSWWCWWYGGSFGQRPMIDFYPLLAIPIAAILDNLFTKKRVVKIVSLSVICIFCLLSLFQNYQYHIGVIHYNSMTKATYKAVFLKTKKPQHYNKTLNKPNPERAMKGYR